MQTYVKNCWYNILAIVIMQQCTMEVALGELAQQSPR